MADDLSARDAKLVQYLNEAYGKEKQLETALEADAKMARARASYRKRLQDHLKETKAQARALERRIKQLGGKAEAAHLPGPDVVSGAAGRAAGAAGRAAAAAKAPVHALRGTGEAEKLLKNAKTQLMNEQAEIGNYLAIETLAEALRDRDTAKLAREFRRQEERMAAFLSKLIPTLTKAVVTEEVPASQRRAAASNGAGRSRRAKPAKARAKRPAKSRAKPAKRAASRSAKPAKTRAKARPAKTRAKARPAKSRAKARPAKRAARSS
jgi:ferritin-like metal-binding protein YciE